MSTRADIHRKLALGTVQFGLAYGVSNAAGKVSEGEARNILERAARSGVTLLDTAAAYGESEEVLSRLSARTRGFDIVTKTQPMADGDADTVIAGVRRSAATLGAPLYAVLVHHARDLRGRQGRKLWTGLNRLRAEGVIKRIGISAYAADDPLSLADAWAPDIMQLPLSLIDQRLEIDGTIAALKSRGVEIHIRSIFLQGIVFLDIAALPPKLAHCRDALRAFHERIAATCMTPLVACLHFALSRENVDRVVVGVTSVAELDAILAAARHPAPKVGWAALAMDDPILLDPSRWN